MADRLIYREWDGVSHSRLNRKLHPILVADSGLRLPRGRCGGKRIPFWGVILGCNFRNGAPRETASHFDAVAHLVRLPRQALQTKTGWNVNSNRL